MANPQPSDTRTNSVQLRQKAERRYYRLLNRLFRRAEQEIVGLEDPEKIIRALNHLSESRLFIEWAREAARQMATILAVDQKATWRLAAKASSQGRMIYKALLKETTKTAIGQTIQDIVVENSRLIKTVPSNMAKQLSKLAQKRWMEGKRPYEITQEILKKANHLREFEARRIARTESAKASSALVQARAEALGLEFYIWRTARDGDRVRKSHQIMEGVICRWSEAPNPEAMAGEKSRGPYHAGGIYNCRCIPLPVLALEDIEFPCKAHKGGAIHKVGSLVQFKRLFGI